MGFTLLAHPVCWQCQETTGQESTVTLSADVSVSSLLTHGDCVSRVGSTSATSHDDDTLSLAQLTGFLSASASPTFSRQIDVEHKVSDDKSQAPSDDITVKSVSLLTAAESVLLPASGNVTVASADWESEHSAATNEGSTSHSGKGLMSLWQSEDGLKGASTLCTSCTSRFTPTSQRLTYTPSHTRRRISVKSFIRMTM